MIIRKIRQIFKASMWRVFVIPFVLFILTSHATPSKSNHKVVHQRVDGNSNLGKLTITDCKQENIKVPTI